MISPNLHILLLGICQVPILSICVALYTGCHLDICMENVMLQNCAFHEQADGYYTVNPNIQIKLGDFGVCYIHHTLFLYGPRVVYFIFLLLYLHLLIYAHIKTFCTMHSKYITFCLCLLCPCNILFW